jgi:hypothetical protein
MLIAELNGLPTVSGFASFDPPDRNFGNRELSGYNERVMTYAARHGLSRLCRLDLAAHRWVANDEQP